MAKKRMVDFLPENTEELLWYGMDVTDSRDFRKIVNKIKFAIRKSFEYDIWQSRSKQHVDECPVCGDNFQFMVAETHHYPETIDDVVSDYLQEKIMTNTINDYTGFKIMEDVMFQHLLGKVNYIVLCKTCHERFHNNDPEYILKVKEAYQKIMTDHPKYYEKIWGGFNKEKTQNEINIK